MILSVNMLLNINETEDSYTYRVLRLDPSGSITLINISDKSALPIILDTSIIIDGFDDGTVSIEPDDPFRVGLLEDEIPSNYKERRDAAWNLISPLVGSKNADIFDPKKRGALIQILHLTTGRRKSTIYGFLKRYWRGGQVKNALLPYWDRCGGPGKIRPCPEKKRGRPVIPDSNNLNEIGMGTNVDEIMRGKILIGAKAYFEHKKCSLKDAWKYTLKRFFMEKKYTEGTFERELVEKYPSYSEFRYWYYKSRDYTTSITNREGERKVALKNRPKTGRSTDISFGPGSIFQIDATLGDIYLVSIFDTTKIIGRPVIYLIADVFSYKVVGFYVGIDTMSKVSAMLALENALSGKVEFCGRYGINISETDWSANHKPEILLADRAELIGYYGNDLVNAGIDVSNTASYRADMKGLVEYCFKLLNIRAIHDIPGSTEKPRQRGERDPRLDATLNIFEFTQVLINTILYLNRRQLKDYPVNSDIIMQKVDLKPHSIWEWGIHHRNGALTVLDDTQRKLLLYPRALSSVTDRGLRFNNHYYYDPAIHNWLFKAGRDGVWKEQIAYHPRDTNKIYLISPDKRSLKALARLDNAGDEYFNCASFEDFNMYYLEKKSNERISDKTELEDWAVLKDKNEATIKKAKDKKANYNAFPQSKSERLNGINANRQNEQKMLNQQKIPPSQNTAAPISEGYPYVAPVIDLNKWQK